tara:strand:+ start:59 stop:325 length:267 start_codon:yes stop_codon:yes gene_type:complete
MNIEIWNNLNVNEQKEFKLKLEKKILKQTYEIDQLVRIAPWCKDKFRLAAIIEIPSWDKNSVRCQYIDAFGLSQPPFQANKGNLEVIK